MLWRDAQLTCEAAREPAMPEKFRLTVHVPKARNLTAADWNGFSDPYVILYVSDANKSQQTETVEANLNPGAWRALFADRCSCVRTRSCACISHLICFARITCLGCNRMDED